MMAKTLASSKANLKFRDCMATEWPSLGLGDQARHTGWAAGISNVGAQGSWFFSGFASIWKEAITEWLGVEGTMEIISPNGPCSNGAAWSQMSRTMSRELWVFPRISIPKLPGHPDSRKVSLMFRQSPQCCSLCCVWVSRDRSCHCSELMELHENPPGRLPSANQGYSVSFLQLPDMNGIAKLQDSKWDFLWLKTLNLQESKERRDSPL